MRTHKVRGIVVFAVLVATPLFFGTVVAQKQSVPRPPDKLALGENQVKELVLLMDTSQNGKISKQEYMHFMEAEFNRLDRNKIGELDPKELKQPKFRRTQLSVVGK